ncbi:NAD(P)-binding domain-containing protein [Dehalococcoidia bacterium]|nr:NAD(P)-binding domain-containing protein [Dehalococcoidia bacterium]
MAYNTVNKIVVTWDGWRDRILKKAQSDEYSSKSFFVSEDREALIRELEDADVALVAMWDPELLAACHNLRWVHAVGGGIEGHLFPEFVQSGVPFTCGKPTFGVPGAESALAAMLMVTRRNHYAIGHSKTTHWLQSRDDELFPEDLSGKTVGIIGMGQMGQALAPRAAALGMRVFSATRTLRHASEGVERSYTIDQMDEFLELLDFVVVAVPSTPQTKGMINQSVFKAMKKNAWIIDISGRTSIFDFPMLAKAIDQNSIAGICTQPSGYSPDQGMPPKESSFWRRENVYVSPCRGTSQEQVAAGLNLFFDNLRNFEAGEPLDGLVDKQAGY